MNDDRIEAVIAALETLVDAEALRRKKQESQVAAMREVLKVVPGSGTGAVGKADPLDLGLDKMREKLENNLEESQARMRASLEREKRILHNLERQTELLEKILEKLESNA